MVDVVTPEVRSRMMAGIKGKNTKPELILRSGLHALGFRFRLHDRWLPGKPDLVFPKYSAVIFAHGCFWHGHDCHLFKWPASKPDFWRTKILGNKKLDAINERQLLNSGWRIAVVWECALKGRSRLSVNEVSERCANWLVSEKTTARIKGR